MTNSKRMSANDPHANVLLPNFLSQMNAFVMDCQVIMAPEALAAFLTLVGLLTCNKHELVKVKAVNAAKQTQKRLLRLASCCMSNTVPECIF